MIPRYHYLVLLNLEYLLILIKHYVFYNKTSYIYKTCKIIITKVHQKYHQDTPSNPL